MKISNKISYPYPIWGWKDDYTLKKPDFDIIEEESDRDNYVFALSAKTTNPDIDKLIADEKAIYACVIDCSKSFYHDIQMSSDASFKVMVPRNEVIGKVEFKWMILAKEEISTFISSLLNDDYDGEASFPQGAMLAHIASFDINAEITDHPHSLDDIIVVMKNLDDNTVKVEFNKSKIVIRLPEDPLENFKLASNSHPHTMLASLYIKALAEGVNNLSDPNYADQDWAITLVDFIQSLEGYEDYESESQLSFNQCMEIAERILRYPYPEMLQEVATTELPQ